MLARDLLIEYFTDLLGMYGSRFGTQFDVQFTPILYLASF